MIFWLLIRGIIPLSVLLIHFLNDIAYNTFILTKNIRHLEHNPSQTKVTVGAGHLLSWFTREMAKNAIQGFEGLCGIPGTILSEMLTGGQRPFGSSYRVRVGHPSGILTVEACVDQGRAQELHVKSAVIGRTARVLMEGVAFIR